MEYEEKVDEGRGGKLGKGSAIKRVHQAQLVVR